MGRYTIISYDNSTFAEGGSPMNRGEYESPAMAIERAKELVDQALKEHLEVAQDAGRFDDVLFDLWQRGGLHPR